MIFDVSVVVVELVPAADGVRQSKIVEEQQLIMELLLLLQDLVAAGARVVELLKQ